MYVWPDDQEVQDGYDNLEPRFQTALPPVVSSLILEDKKQCTTPKLKPGLLLQSPDLCSALFLDLKLVNEKLMNQDVSSARNEQLP